MAALRRFVQRIMATLRPNRAEDELDREVAAHLKLLEDQFRDQGMPADAARMAARRAFGGIDQAKEHQRDARSFRWISDLRQDIVYGARSFARSSGFTTAAAITLALGIGAATTIFAALYSVSLKPLSYADPDRVIRIFESVPPRDGVGAPRRGNPFAPVNLDAIRQASTLSHAGMQIPRLMIMNTADSPMRIVGSRVSAAMFPLLGVQPMLGRWFDEQEERPGSDNVVIVSYALWQQHLAGASDAIGKTLILDDRPHAVVGVMPRGFQFPPGTTSDFWTPLIVAGTTPTFRLPLYARLRDGASVAAAHDEIAAIYDSVRSTTAANRPRLEVVAMKDALVEPFKPAINVLTMAVVLVLLIACVNVANLVLARSTVRQYEMALRTALGASRTRLLRQHLAEGTLLALLSGAGGVALAWIGVLWLRAFGDAGPRRDMLPGINIPRLADIAVDPVVIAFAVGISLLAGLGFGVIAAARHPVALTPALHRDRRRRFGVQQLLIGVEVAMAVVLFIGSALMMRSLINLSAVDMGFTTRDVVTFQASLPPSRSVTEVTSFAETLSTRIAALPSVDRVAYAESLPMVPVGRPAPLSKTPVFPKPDPAAPPSLDVRIVSHGYTDVMGMRIVAGRGFTEDDAAGRPRVMLINETLQRQLFSGEAAVGQRLFIGGPTFDPRGRVGPLEPWEIVGVVADVRQRSVIDPAAPQIFIDQRQVPGPTGVTAINVVVRMNGGAAALLSNARAMVRQLDPMAFVDNIAPMESLVSNSYARPRLYALTLAIYAAVAISLVAVGIYGVIAFAVVQRTREIGIRIALGAQRRQVRGLVVRDSALVAGVGLLAGVIAAVWSSRLFEGLLFGVTPLDRATYAVVAAAFAVIAMLAAFIPARRASVIDPAMTLRVE